MIVGKNFALRLDGFNMMILICISETFGAFQKIDTGTSGAGWLKNVDLSLKSGIKRFSAQSLHRKITRIKFNGKHIVMRKRTNINEIFNEFKRFLKVR